MASRGQYATGRFVCSVINGLTKIKLLDSTGSVVILHIRDGKVFGLTADDGKSRKRPSKGQ
jgi:hypothetical protein